MVLSIFGGEWLYPFPLPDRPTHRHGIADDTAKAQPSSSYPFRKCNEPCGGAGGVDFIIFALTLDLKTDNP